MDLKAASKTLSVPWHSLQRMVWLAETSNLCVSDIAYTKLEQKTVLENKIEEFIEIVLKMEEKFNV